MKTRMLLGALCTLLLLQSCNNLFKDNEPIVMKYTTHKEALDTLRKKYLEANNLPDSLPKEEIKRMQGKHISYALLSPDSAKQFLSTVNFKYLLGSKNGPDIYNGFFGADHYRIEFFLANAEIDSSAGGLISLQGKTRFKKNIQSFKGKIEIDSVYEFRDSVVMGYWDEYANGQIQSYYLRGKFQFAEDSSKWGGGQYKGDFYMDLQVNHQYESERGGQSYWYYSDGEYMAEEVEPGDTTNTGLQMGSETKSGTRGAGFLFDGSWTSYKSHENKPLLLAHDVFMFGNDILENFSYGSREIEINPKYASLGWDNFWENDEWYNDENANVMMIFR